MERCHEIRELADLAGLPAGDPRREHLDACPRCRGLARAQALFADPGDTSDLEDFAGADAELARRLAPSLATSPAPVARSARRRGPWYALAAVLAVCALGVATSEMLDLRGTAGPRVGERVRGGEVADLVVTGDDGVLRGVWSAAPVADSYVLELLDANLAAIDRREITGPDFTQPLAELPPAAVYCRTVAVSSGDTLARSGIVALPPAGEVR